MTPRLVTAVVGAGPAGLLFCIAGRVLAERAGVAEAWALHLFDKREQYARTHRLRLARAAYEELAASLDHPLVHGLVAYLQEVDFAPEVNLLEGRLSAVARELGVVRERLAVGGAEGEASLAALRVRLAPEGVPFTIVGADSVHSAVRRLAAPEDVPRRQRHERLARLRVEGSDLPARLGPAERFRYAKLLGSIVDYRRNANGFAEVDLFLTAREHERVAALGASPRAPVALDPAAVRGLRAPLFAGIVAHLSRGTGPRTVSLSSTFALEHAIAQRRVIAHEPVGAVVLLVGDAAASLPFQRGMSCLARSALCLARAHVAALQAPHLERTPAALATRFAAFDREVEAIVASELAVVRSRAWLVRALRETIRVASLAPFPIQSWWLGAPVLDPRRERPSPWHVVNGSFALATGALALGGSILRAEGWAWGPHSAWLAVFLELGGGFLYRGSLDLLGEPAPRLRRIWQVQLAMIFVGGVCITAWASWQAGRLSQPFAAVWSLRLAAAFVAGLYLFEFVARRTATRAGFDEG